MKNILICIIIFIIIIEICFYIIKNIYIYKKSSKYIEEKYNNAINDVLDIFINSKYEWWFTEGTLLGSLRFGGNFGVLHQFKQLVNSNIDIMIRVKTQEEWEKKMIPELIDKFKSKRWDKYSILSTNNTKEIYKLKIKYDNKKYLLTNETIYINIHRYKVKNNIVYGNESLVNFRSGEKENNNQKREECLIYPFNTGKVKYKGFIVNNEGKFSKCLYNNREVPCIYKVEEFLRIYGNDNYGYNEQIKIIINKKYNKRWIYNNIPKLCIRDLYRLYYYAKQLNDNGYRSYYDKMINFKKEINDLTIITGYFYINKSKKISNLELPSNYKSGDEAYKNWMKGMLSYSGPMIIFTEEKEKEYIKKIRGNLPTKIIITNKSKFLSYKYNNKFNLESNKKEYEYFIKNNIEYNELFLIWNEKVNFLKIASELNPYNTKYFMWYDIGNLRFNQRIPYTWPNINKLSVMDNNFIMFTKDSKDDQPTYPKDKILIIGGAFGGIKENIKKYHKIYYNTLEKLYKKNEFLGIDQYIFANIYENINDLTEKVNIKLIKLKEHSFVKNDQWFYTIPYFF
jgi:hypothetical protein